MVHIKTESGKEVYCGDWEKGLFDRCYAYVEKTQAPLIAYTPEGVRLFTMDTDSPYFDQKRERKQEHETHHRRQGLSRYLPPH